MGVICPNMSGQPGKSFCPLQQQAHLADLALPSAKDNCVLRGCKSGDQNEETTHKILCLLSLPLGTAEWNLSTAKEIETSHACVAQLVADNQVNFGTEKSGISDSPYRSKQRLGPQLVFHCFSAALGDMRLALHPSNRGTAADTAGLKITPSNQN